LFLVEFTNEGDKRRVLEGRPWVFEGSLFLPEDFDGCTSPSDITFEKAAFLDQDDWSTFGLHGKRNWRDDWVLGWRSGGC
jgi:hypothetical protein